MQTTKRVLGHYDFEGGAVVEIVCIGNISTLEALDMATTLIKLKRDELNERDGTRIKAVS